MSKRVFSLACLSCIVIATSAAVAQERREGVGRTLLDDLPKEKKEAAKDARGDRPAKKTERDVMPALPKTDLVDDLSPERKQAAAQRSAAEHLASAIPDNLGEALARALHNSPTVLVAEAKVRQAQAELNEVKLSVTHDMTLAFQRRAGSKLLMERYKASDDVGTLNEAGRVEMEKCRQTILEDESRTIYLLGVGSESPAERSRSRHGEGGMMQGGMMGGMMPGMGGGMMAGGMGGGMMPGGMGGGMMAGGMGGGMMAGGMGGGMMPGMAGKPSRPTPSKSPAAPPTTAAKPQSDLPEKFQKFLQAVTEFDFAEQPLSDVLEYLKQRHGGDVNFVGTEKLGGPDVTLSLKNITVEAGLQALADLTGHCFIFRDYGILVMHSKDAKSYLESGIPMIAPVLPTQTPDATKRRD